MEPDDSFDEKSESLFDKICDFISEQDSVTIASIAVALVAVVFTIVYLILKGRTSSRRTVLIAGPCDAGKTLLFSRLIYDKFMQTQTSMAENSGMFSPGNNKSNLKVIDIPGHERVRQQYFDKFKTSVRGIIFVIDSLSFQKEVKDVAELLYVILTDRVIMKNAPALLIACNKHDQALAKGARLIQTALEKELNNVRRTRAAALEATGDSTKASAPLGRLDRDFTFSDVRPMCVEFVECSARGASEDSQPQLNTVRDWLIKLA